MTKEEIEKMKEEINSVAWWHSIDLGEPFGVTPGRVTQRTDLMRIPKDLTGKTVLDVGCWDGVYSFEAERNGAKEILATDSWVWVNHKTKDKGFHLAKKILKSNVKSKFVDVLELSPEAVGTFDLVFFMGVLYHMIHPLVALEKVSSVTKSHLIVETLIDLRIEDLSFPALAFYPKGEVRNDPTCWFGPNRLAVRAMLEVVGFKEIIEYPGIGGGRKIFHAFK